VVTDQYGLQYEVPDPREPVAFDLAVDGVYEPATLDCILGRLHHGGVFVDVGANVGAVSLPVAQHVGPGGRVIAVEASPLVFPFLTRNVEANHLAHVTCQQVAAVPQGGAVQFYPAPNDHFGMGALAPQFHATPVWVRGAPLDALLEEAAVSTVDVLKIDVEGFEGGAILGARRLLQGHRPPLVVFEFCDWAEARVPGGHVGDAQRLLRDWGFSIWTLGDFAGRRPPLGAPLLSGFQMMVAEK